MRFRHFSLLFTLPFFTPSMAQKADRAFIKEVVDLYNNQSSISYDIDYKMKYFDNEPDDIITVKGHCELIRETADTLFGGKVWLDIYENEGGDFSDYYDLNAIHVMEHTKKEVIKFNTKNGDTGPLTGATQAGIKNTFFMKPSRVLEYMEAPGNTYSLKDTLINKKPYVFAAIQFADQDDLHDKVMTVLMNRDSKKIERITNHVELSDQYQYNEWNLKNIVFNSVTTAALNKKLADYKSAYTSKDFVREEYEEIMPLSVSMPAPAFTGKLFDSGKEVSLADYKGKVIILDFWYAACYPCALAVPSLNNLQAKYKEKIVVLGLNPLDNSEKAMKKIPGFIKRNNVGYPLAITDNAVAAAYQVNGYPTLYVIDKDGIIQYSEPGFGEEMEMNLSKIIDGLLAN